ncbi:MAG: LPS assembly protein LptD, partial [Desulfobacterales bacterium]|nr:LPS assembly protein LptD [Desulfobacterales bacterium]
YKIKKYLRFAVLLASFFVFFFNGLQVMAQSDDQSGSQKGIPWHILADEVRYDKNTDQYFASGNVVITKENLKLSADRVQFQHNTMEVFADGHVMLISGKDILTGERMEMDLNKEVGIVFNGTIFIERNHFYIRGDRLEKTGKDTYRAERATLTSCDGEKPAWKINARNVKVTVEGYGSARHASLLARDIPVFYSPYFFFPVKLNRQTGFLTPQLGYSDRKGIEYVQPFFWAIDKSSDATFYEHFMDLRGNKLGAEYRYMLSHETKGAVMADILNDRKVDDGIGNNSNEWGYTDDQYLRPNEDRYWFRMKHDQELPSGFSGRLDLDIVSDQDYLNEFEKGYAGFDETKRYFLSEFGRDIDDYNDPVRFNRLNIFKNWNHYSLNAEAQWYDDVVRRRQKDSDRDPPLQRLPFISFNSLRQPLVTPTLLYDLESEYTNFFREDSYTGQRIDIHPRFYLPLRYKHYFSIEPSVGFRETLWYLDDREDFSGSSNNSFNRELVDAELDLSTDLSRSYVLNSKTTDRIRHTIRPQVVYQFIPPTSQDNLPEFDDVDRIEKTSVATYSITNTFSLRSRLPEEQMKYTSVKESTDDAKIVDSSPGYAYQPFCRFKVEQSYDFNETIEDEPFSPIYARLDLKAGRLLSLNADAQWSTYESRFLTHNAAVTASDKRGDQVFLQHRYTKDRQETFYGEGIINLHERIGMFVEYERNIKDGNTLLYGVGFLYMASCWSLDIGYADEEGDKKYALMVNLYGLGGLGTAYAGRKIENPFAYH